MVSVITPFRRTKRSAPADPADARHRRDGFFDDHDVWHDADSRQVLAADAHA